jgi:hypothetical protein
VTVIASAASAAAPLNGQDNRFGTNLQLVSNDQSTITIVAPAGVVFKVMQDRSAVHDPTIIHQGQNGATVTGGTLAMDTNYYIADPVNATVSFAVQFDQD